MLEWGEGVSEPCAVVWEKDNKGSGGRTRYLSPPPLSLFNQHQEGQRAEESEVCMGFERWERGAAVLSCGHRGCRGSTALHKGPQWAAGSDGTGGRATQLPCGQPAEGLPLSAPMKQSE